MANITDSAYGKNLWIAGGFKYVPTNGQDLDHVKEQPVIFTSKSPSFGQNDRTQVTLPFNSLGGEQNNRITCIRSGNDKFVCIRFLNQHTTAIGYSIDGTNWSISKSDADNTRLFDIEYGNNNWVAVGDNGNMGPIVLYSNNIGNGDNWTSAELPNNVENLNCITYENNTFYAFGNSRGGQPASFITSVNNGISWSRIDLPTTYLFNINSVAYDETNDVMVVCGDDGTNGFYATRVANVWDQNPTALKTGTKYNSVVFTGNHFYIGGENGSLHIADATANPLVFNEDPTNATGHINTLSFAKNTLLIGLVGRGGVDDNNDGNVDLDTNGDQIVNQDGGVATKIDTGDREITLGGDLVTDGDFTTIGCNVVIEAISDHSHNDNQKKLTLHGDLEISNKNIAFDSNNDNHKITVTSNTTIDQNLSQSSEVTFGNIILAPGAPGGSGSVASINYVQDQTDFASLYANADANNANSTAAKLDVLLRALGITTTAGGSSGGSVNGSKVTNGLIQINKLDGDLNIVNNQWLKRNGDFNGNNNDEETYLSVTDTNGEYVLPENAKNALTNGNFYEITSSIITQQMIIDNNSSFASILVDRPTYDSNSGIEEEIPKSVMHKGAWPTSGHLSLNYATTLGAILARKNKEDGSDADQALTDADTALVTIMKDNTGAAQYTIEDIKEKNHYKERLDGATDADKNRADDFIDKNSQLGNVVKASLKVFNESNSGGTAANDTEAIKEINKSIIEGSKDSGGTIQPIFDDKIEMLPAVYQKPTENTKIVDDANKDKAKRFLNSIKAVENQTKKDGGTDLTALRNKNAAQINKIGTRRAQITKTLKTANFRLQDFEDVDSNTTDHKDPDKNTSFITQLINNTEENETEINQVKKDYKADIIKFIDETLPAATAFGNEMEIVLKVNKTKNVEFSIEENPSELVFNESRIRDTFTLKITPTEAQVGKHTIIVSATHDGETIKKSINLTVNGTQTVTSYTDAPATDFNNTDFLEELEQVDNDDPEKDLFAFKTENDYDDSVAIDVTDPDNQKSNDFNIVNIKTKSTATATAAANSNRRKIRGRAFKFGLYKFKVKITHRGTRIVKFKTIYIKKKIYVKQLDFNDLGFFPNTEYIIRYVNGKEKLDIVVDSGTSAGKNQNTKNKDMTFNIISDIIASVTYKSLNSNFQIRYVKPGVIEFVGNRLVNNISLEFPNFVFDSDLIKSIKDVDTIVAKLELPTFYNNVDKLTWTSSNNNFVILNDNFVEQDKNNNIGNIAYLQAKIGNTEKVNITANYKDGDKQINETYTNTFTVEINSQDIILHYDRQNGGVYLYNKHENINTYQLKFFNHQTPNNELLLTNTLPGWSIKKANQADDNDDATKGQNAIVGYGNTTLPTGKWVEILKNGTYVGNGGTKRAYNLDHNNISDNAWFDGNFNLFASSNNSYPITDNKFNWEGFPPIPPQNGE